MSDLWYWPGGDEVNDVPDPLGIEDQWKPWSGTMEQGPSVFAEIFAREYIQNSWDSIQQASTSVNFKDQRDRPSITFRFVELSGPNAKAFMKNFGLAEHAKRLKTMEPEQLVDNRLGDTFLGEEKHESVRILIASESHAEGMPGKWDSGDLIENAPSRMRIALIQSVTGKSGLGTGGSWGEGKKAIAAASKARVLAAYSCHLPDNENVTRRFMGVTYWRLHNSETKRHRGMGLCGALVQSPPSFANFEPLKDQTADDFVRELNVDGFETRDPNLPGNRGTSYIFVDPSFSPEDLAKAIERNWWPLLETHRVNIEVHDYSGAALEISPRGDGNLFPFIKAFDIARGLDEPQDKVGLRTEVRVGHARVGSLAVIADVSEGGWSYEQTPNGNVDLVALVRNDMVIAYQRFPKIQKRKPPFVRGCFVVTDAEASRTLKMTEGHLHNMWKDDPQSVGDSTRAAYAHSVIEQISKNVNYLRNGVTSSEEALDVRIRAFEKVFSGKGPSVGRSDPGKKTGDRKRIFTIQNVSRTVRDYKSGDPTQLRLHGRAKIAIKPDRANSHLRVIIDLGWAVFEEAGPHRDETLSDPSSMTLPDGFELQGKVLVGLLTKEPVQFEWSSTYFPDDWQVVPDPQVKSASAGETQ